VKFSLPYPNHPHPHRLRPLRQPRIERRQRVAAQRGDRQVECVGGALPSGRFAERSSGIAHLGRELRCRNRSSANWLDEVSERGERSTDPPLRIENPDRLAKPVAHLGNRFLQVAIVADDNCAIEQIIESIHQQQRRKVDVRSLFLGLDNPLPNEAPGIPRRRIGHRHFVGQEMAQMDRKPRLSAQRPKIGLLATGLIGIVGACADRRGEIANCLDTIASQQIVAERRGIQPLVRRPLEATEIEVEAVDIDVCPHSGST
jgi:hypothetical protein